MMDEKQDKNTSPHKSSFSLTPVSKEEYDQLQDEETPPPKLNISFTDSRTIILSGLLIVALFFGVGGLWVTFAEISGAVIAQGEVRVDTQRKTVQHLEGGIVREILVKNGDRVIAGQPLFLLERSVIMSTVDQLSTQIAAAKMSIAWLQAERDGLAQPDWPDCSDNVSESDCAELKNADEKVFLSRRQSHLEEIGLLNNQIVQMHEQIKGLNERFAASEQIINALQEELKAKESLLEEHYIDKTAVLSLRRALAEQIGAKGQLRGTIAEVRERIAEYKLRITAVKSKKREEATTALAETHQRLFSLKQQLEPQLDARERLTVIAPVNGQVVDLQVHSIGGVVSPGQPLLDIVPEDTPLIVECSIMVADIARVFEGQETDVQLMAFPTRNTPKVPGKVVYLSADRLLKQTSYGELATYLVHIELDRQVLIDNDLYLTAGMPATVFIRTKPRTLLDYIMEPMLSNFDHALRES